MARKGQASKEWSSSSAPGQGSGKVFSSVEKAFVTEKVWAYFTSITLHLPRQSREPGEVVCHHDNLV